MPMFIIALLAALLISAPVRAQRQPEAFPPPVIVVIDTVTAAVAESSGAVDASRVSGSSAGLAAALTGFSGQLRRITAAARAGAEPPPGLMNAIYDFRQAARETLGGRLQDKGRLDFKTNAELLRKDSDVLSKYSAKLSPERADRLLPALSALDTAARRLGADDLDAAGVARKKLKAKVKTAKETRVCARGKLARSSGASARALRDAIVSGALAELRAALEAYKFDKGRYPDNPSSLAGVYLDAIPPFEFPGHVSSCAVRLIRRDTYADHGDAVTGSGGWLYVADRQSVFFGKIFANSRKLSSSGKPWFRY